MTAISRNSDFLFRMVLVAHEGNEYGGEPTAQDWIVTATFRRLRSGRERATLQAEHVQTGVVLTCPKDADSIIKVLPEDHWPEFIKKMCSEVPGTNQPTLLAEG